MAINGIRPVGDDQAWKAEVERQLKELKDIVAALTANAKGR